VLRSKDGTGEENKINQRREGKKTENDKRTEEKTEGKKKGDRERRREKKRQWETAEMEKLGSQVTRLFQLSVVDLGPRYHRL